MPNWCINQLEINGPKGALDSFRKHAEHQVTETNPEPSVLSFQATVPMPESLRVSIRGSCSLIGYDAFHGDYKTVMAYSWIPEGVKSVAELQAYLDTMSPEYRIQGDLAKANMDAYGYPDWLAWAGDKWGTKWDAQETSVYDEGTKLTYTFDTAWSPPVPWATTVSKQFPELHFKLAFEEPGMDFTGWVSVQNGEVLDDMEEACWIAIPPDDMDCDDMKYDDFDESDFYSMGYVHDPDKTGLLLEDWEASQSLKSTKIN